MFLEGLIPFIIKQVSCATCKDARAQRESRIDKLSSSIEIKDDKIDDLTEHLREKEETNRGLQDQISKKEETIQEQYPIQEGELNILVITPTKIRSWGPLAK